MNHQFRIGTMKYSKSHKPQRFTLSPLLNNKQIKETKIKKEEKKMKDFDKTLAKQKKHKIRKIVSEKLFKNPKATLGSSNYSNVSKSSKILFDEIFLKKLNKEEMIRTPQSCEQEYLRFNDNSEHKDYDEGLKTIKEVTKKMKYYEIYEIISRKKKQEKKSRKNLNRAVFKVNLSFSNNSHISHTKDTFLFKKSYFSNQIQLEIPNILNINQSNPGMPGIEINSINNKILDNFNKSDILIKMKTNFMKKGNHHDF